MSLHIEGLTVDLGGHRIVEDVSIDVATGSFVGLLGPNGSGKSTVLKTVYRVNTPTSGSVLLDRFDLLALRARHAALRLAVVAQDTSLEFDATVAEVVMVGRHPHKTAFQTDDRLDVAEVARALDAVGCAELANRSVLTLSGGERQRVFLARALAQGCDHLLLDEPTNHLDIRFQVDVLDLLAHQASSGATVFAALHDLSLAALYCDRVYVLAAGRVVASGTPRDVITAELVREVYGAEVIVIDHPETGTPHIISRRTSPAPPETRNT